MKETLIVGCGAVGRGIGASLEGGSRVLGIVRTRGSAERLHALGIEARTLDLGTDGFPPDLGEGRDVYYLAPPPPEGDRDSRIRKFGDWAARNPPRRVVYLSTSGVYGDCGGAWVDESIPPCPRTARARRRLDAERQIAVLARHCGVETVVLRVGGIYGPGRLPVSRIANMTVVCPDQAPYSNRIHAEDLVRVCVAAMERGRDGAVYNVSDGNPTTMTDYLYRVADAVGVPRPPCVPLDRAGEHLSPAMLSFIRESRRLRVHRMLDELQVELRYPDLEAGLAASL